MNVKTDSASTRISGKMLAATDGKTELAMKAMESMNVKASPPQAPKEQYVTLAGGDPDASLANLYFEEQLHAFGA